MSTLTKRDICNLALSKIGGAANSRLNYLSTYDGTPSDPTERQALGWCQTLLPIVQEKVQGMMNWPETRKYVDPGAALAEGSYHTSAGWEYMYTRPTDLIKIWGVVDDDELDEDSKPISLPYEIIQDQIACDYEDILVVGSVRLDDVTKWSVEMVEVTACLLAVYLAKPMGANDQGRSALWKEYLDMRTEAMSACKIQDFEEAAVDYDPHDEVDY